MRRGCQNFRVLELSYDIICTSLLSLLTLLLTLGLLLLHSLTFEIFLFFGTLLILLLFAAHDLELYYILFPVLYLFMYISYKHKYHKNHKKNISILHIQILLSGSTLIIFHKLDSITHPIRQSTIYSTFKPRIN